MRPQTVLSKAVFSLLQSRLSSEQTCRNEEARRLVQYSAGHVCPAQNNAELSRPSFRDLGHLHQFVFDLINNYVIHGSESSPRQTHDEEQHSKNSKGPSQNYFQQNFLQIL